MFYIRTGNSNDANKQFFNLYFEYVFIKDDNPSNCSVINKNKYETPEVFLID